MLTSRIGRFVALSIVAGATVVGSVAAGAAAANAVPRDCLTGWATDGAARGECSSGSGQFRIGIPCKSIQTLGYGFTQYSPWVNKGEVATVRCGFGAWLWTDISPSGPHIFLEKRD